VHPHGGTIAVESNETATTFTITLPSADGVGGATG
jgi:signal transduction histidine kinase